MSHVLLGMPGKWAENNHEPADHYTTKIGGVPDWPSKELNLKPELLKCQLCHADLYLVSQVCAPVFVNKMSIEERVIYVLGCPRPKCSSNPLSWRALRVQEWRSKSHSIEDPPEQMQVDLSRSISQADNGLTNNTHKIEDPEKLENDDNNNNDNNSDDDSDIDLKELNRALSEALILASSSKNQSGKAKRKPVAKSHKRKPKVVDGKDIPVMPCFYIYSKEEASIAPLVNASNLPEDSDVEEWREEYEYDSALNADRSYLKFKKRLDSYPDQCIRYLFGGRPLLPRENIGKPGACGVCGAMRQYEMQLMSPLLYFLQEAADATSLSSIKEWDWMTVIIYTCPNSCFQENRKGNSDTNCWTVVEESIIVYFDDLASAMS